MRKTKLAAIAATLALAVFIGSASMASAWGGHNGGGYGHGGCYHGGGYGPGPQAMSSEQQALYNDYDKKATPLVSQLRAKQAEMDSLYAQGTPDAAKTQALAKEIGDIQGRLYQLDSEFGSKMRSSDGYAGGGYGWGHRGGRGSGGHHGGGHGW